MLLLYVPMEGEIGLLPLARMARERGIPIAFPKCDPKTGSMAFYTLNADARLSPGAYGIPEPPDDAPLCVPDERALCILPGLAFSEDGHRLGYGKGYYDRYLSDFHGVTVGAVCSKLLLPHVPTDEHDVPSQILVTENGPLLPAPAHDELSALSFEDGAEYDWRHADEPTKSKKQTTPALSVKERTARLWHTVKKATAKAWHAMWKGEHTEGARTPHAPVVLVLITFVLLLLSRPVDAYLLDRSSEYVGVILLQILIFILPAILYGKIRGTRLTERIRFSPPRLSHILLLACLLVMMITGGLLTSILTGGIESLSGSFTLYDTFIARTSTPMDILYAILAYACLPAIGEELVYRAILCAEYEKHGASVAATVSALYFAMLHFSLPNFLTYFVLGLLLAFSMYVTRSAITPLLLHLCYNVFCLFGQPFLTAFFINAGSTEIFTFCLVVLLLLSSALAAGEARKIYHVYAIKNISSEHTKPLPWKQYPKALLFSLLSPVGGVCLLLWLIVSLINLS